MEPIIITRDEFLQRYWKYYLLLEKDFLSTERYLAIDGLNAKAFSNEYIKQYQAICSEIDVVAKSFCKELDAHFNKKTIDEYCKCITANNPDFSMRKLKLLNRNMDETPWKDWKYTESLNGTKIKVQANNPAWWKMYNRIKHNRTTTNTDSGLPYYKLANQENLICALGALFQLEMYYYRVLHDKYFPRDPDMPCYVSELFEIEGWGNRWTMLTSNIAFKTE